MIGHSNLRLQTAATLTCAILFGAYATRMLAQSEPCTSPAELVRKTVQNELKESSANAAHYMFRSQKETPQGIQTKLYIQTRDATVGLIVAVNGKPLTPEQRQAEEARVERFIENPQELQHKRKQEKEDEEHTTRIMRALPEAFIFDCDGTFPGQEGLGAPGDDLVKLRFHPNPKYNPPSRVEQVLTGMHGVLLIDAKRNRIAEIDGTLFKEVGFGWGILGHLDKGGHFLVQQTAVPEDGWEVSRMNLSFTGKIMMVKRLTIKSDEVFSDYRPVPRDLTFAQGFELLKKQEAVFAQNQMSGPAR